jgi:DNA replication and repair protein RecF
LYNDFQAKSYASEGQQRVSSILIKLAEGIHIKNMKGTYPVILLDDFSSELDNANRGFIGRTFRQFKQIIITTTYKENLKEFKADREFIVSNGKAEII